MRMEMEMGMREMLYWRRLIVSQGAGLVNFFPGLKACVHLEFPPCPLFRFEWLTIGEEIVSDLREEPFPLETSFL